MFTNRISVLTYHSVLALAVLVAFNALGPAAAAQTPDKCAGTIKRALYVQGDTHIYVSLDEPINDQDITGGHGTQWALADLSEIPVKDISVMKVEADNKNKTPTFTSVKLTIGSTLDKDHIYRLAALNLTILGCIPENKGTSDITFHKPMTKPPSTSSFFPPSNATGRNDSNVYILGSIEGARGGKAQFSSDIKIDIPYELHTSHDTEIGPYFDLKASTADDADADSFSTGAKLSTVIYRPDSGLLRNITWSPTAGIESDRHFDNVNGVIGNTLYFVTAGNNGTFKKRIYFQPFIGYEIGRNFKSPVSGAEGHGISRLSAGGSLYYIIPLKGDRAFSIQGDYIRRFLLRREFSFKEDDDKKLVLLNVGRGPRDYLKTNLQYDFAKFTALTLSYEYGRLPPNFTLVDHKYSLGLLLKFKTTFVQK